MWISFKYERLPNMCYWCGRLTHDDRDCGLWIDSEGTLTPEQREFGPFLRAPPFVAARRSAILVPGFYAEKKKRSSGTPEDSDSGRTSVSGGENVPEQPHGVTASINVSLEDEEVIGSLRSNEGDGINMGDTVNQEGIKEKIIEDLKTPKETEFADEGNKEELSLAQEFGAASMLGTGRSLARSPNACENLSARDNLSVNPTLKQSRAAQEVRIHNTPNSRAAQEVRIHNTPNSRVSSTWTRRQREKSKGNTAANFQSQGKKRRAVTEADHNEVSAKRVQKILSGENKTFVMAGADVQPRQQQ